MSSSPTPPPLKALHPEESLSKSKLSQLNRLTTEEITASLQPGQTHSLKIRPDETILDGHHRIEILRSRGVDVNALPREILVRG